MTIDAIADWVGLNVLVIPAIERQTGPFANMLRNLAMLPPVISREAVKVSKITETDGQERLLAPVEAAQNRLDPFAVPIDQGATPQSVRVAEAPSFVPKKLKMAHILDQGDESEFTTRRCWTHYRLVSQLRRNYAQTTRRRGNADERAIIGIERESDRPTGFPLRRFLRFHTLRAENNQSSSFSPLTSLSQTALCWRKKSLVQPIIKLGCIVGEFSVWRV